MYIWTFRLFYTETYDKMHEKISLTIFSKYFMLKESLNFKIKIENYQIDHSYSARHSMNWITRVSEYANKVRASALYVSINFWFKITLNINSIQDINLFKRNIFLNPQMHEFFYSSFFEIGSRRLPTLGRGSHRKFFSMIPSLFKIKILAHGRIDYAKSIWRLKKAYLLSEVIKPYFII